MLSQGVPDAAGVRLLGAAQSGVRGVGFTGHCPPMSDTFGRPAGGQGHSGVMGRSNDLTLKTDADTITESLLGVSNQLGASTQSPGHYLKLS